MADGDHAADDDLYGRVLGELSALRDEVHEVKELVEDNGKQTDDNKRRLDAISPKLDSASEWIDLTDRDLYGPKDERYAAGQAPVVRLVRDLATTMTQVRNVASAAFVVVALLGIDRVIEIVKGLAS